MKIIHAPRASAILYRLLARQRQKDPWLLPSNICPAVPLTFIDARVPFEFVDISKTTLQMDLNHVEAQLMKRPIGGLLYAHTYGEPGTPESLFTLVRSRQPAMLVIDDRCLCTPEFERSTDADVVLFSTGYAKVVDLNRGGYAVVQDHVPLQPFEDCRLPEWDSYRDQIETNLAASLAHRADLNNCYTSRLPAEIQLPAEFQQWRFNIRVRNKSAVMQAIFGNGLFASSHYASLAGVMDSGRALEAETLAGDVINLFNDRHFDVDKAERICEIVKNSGVEAI